ncbi:hypothetical protein DFH07DRAFT_793212 [Mycena maculata]|uniref:Uncharacterized protein n=1 Tax=Mycena maculata TaxID=230809 RepID=A0AAD7KAV4_9AGAR|nr:hypothetical protein DFH07DRAFT_793212 [Mycena maculata]
MFSISPLLLLSLASLVVASPTQQPFRLGADHGSEHEDDGTLAGWLDPRIGGGQLLDFTTKTRGEPLNVIISGTSDPFILTDEGFIVYVESIGYARECMGLHMGHIHLANLGDGDGRKPEALLFRQHYRMPGWGTCWESLAGGHHFRAWRQNGTEGNSGAWFLGASKEEDSRRGHTIVANGYNLGRDWLVEQAVAGSELWVPHDVLSSEAAAALRGSVDQPSHEHRQGETPEPEGWPWPGTGGERIQWRAEVEWRAGLLEPGRKGVNHGIAQDGRVAILTVFRVQSDLG